jgi:hypothetical protein
MQRLLGAAAAVLTWLAWLIICPVFGFPALGTAGMINRALFRSIPQAGHEPNFWVGWVIVIATLVLASALFFAFERTHLLRTSWRTGVIYGVALWLLAGIVIMPLLGLIAPRSPFPANSDAMTATVMMASLGPLAALAALIAWVLFGAILGTTGRTQQ